MVDIDVMPTATRRERAKAEQRQSILDAARTIAAREGWGGVTTRKVAAAIDYSHPMIYTHFDSKDAMLAELNRVGYRALLGLIRAVRARNLPAHDTLSEFALAYCNFAWNKRELYEVMHGLSGAHLEVASYHTEATAVIAEARAALEGWAQANHVRVLDPESAVLLLWSTLHGIASLALAKQMIGGKKRAAVLAVRAMTDLLAGWQARGAV